jgi:uncharacterized protein DUF3515
VPHRHVLSALLLVAALSGCGATLDVDEYPMAPGTKIDCEALIADMPGKVAGQDDRGVSRQIAAAWGDPAIILRCGVEEPEALSRSSPCYTVRDVGWLSETTADGYLFTTIGRTFYVSVEVPKTYDPAADALADLAPSVKKHDPLKQRCV